MRNKVVYDEAQTCVAAGKNERKYVLVENAP